MGSVSIHEFLRTSITLGLLSSCTISENCIKAPKSLVVCYYEVLCSCTWLAHKLAAAQFR